VAENIPTRSRTDAVRSAPAAKAAPAHLSERSRGIWASIHAEYSLGHDGEVLLRAALEQLDLHDEAVELLRREGLTVGKRGSPSRPHPAVSIARQTLTSCRSCFRQLGLQPPEV
jgi:phage terminase small subunit